MNDLLKGYELYGWQPDAGLSNDENFMDLCMIVTRSSKLKQGSMACILVNEAKGQQQQQQQREQPNAIATTDDACEAIVSLANNRSLFSERDSDVHAEIAALGEACRSGIPTQNATAYITMPPCKRCFAALTVAGIRRIVTRYGPSPKLEETATRNNIDWIKIPYQEEQMARINTLIKGDSVGKKRKNHDTDEKSTEKSKYR